MTLHFKIPMEDASYIYIYILWCPPGDDTVSFGLPFIAVPWYIAVRWLSTLLNITI